MSSFWEGFEKRAILGGLIGDWLKKKRDKPKAPTHGPSHHTNDGTTVTGNAGEPWFSHHDEGDDAEYVMHLEDKYPHLVQHVGKPWKSLPHPVRKQLTAAEKDKNPWAYRK